MNTPPLPEKTSSSPPSKLLDQVVAKIRFKHYTVHAEMRRAGSHSGYMHILTDCSEAVIGALQSSPFLKLPNSGVTPAPLPSNPPNHSLDC